MKFLQRSFAHDDCDSCYLPTAPMEKWKKEQITLRLRSFIAIGSSVIPFSLDRLPGLVRSVLRDSLLDFDKQRPRVGVIARNEAEVAGPEHPQPLRALGGAVAESLHQVLHHARGGAPPLRLQRLLLESWGACTIMSWYVSITSSIRIATRGSLEYILPLRPA
eukprot:2121755-Rhodomonas_salina.2